MANESDPPSPRAARARRALWWAVGLTLALYVIPLGRLALYPIMLFGTFVHEMGHGIAALLVGGSFQRFRMWADGSGIATTSGVADGLPRAIVSAGGLIGPTLLGAVLFFVARRARRSRWALYVFGAALVVADVVWVRNAFGLVYVGLVAAVVWWAARRFSEEGAQITLVFVAMQLCLSVFSDVGYMFSKQAKTSGGTIPSDTANIATALGGTYWMWGAVVAALAVTAVLVGLEQFLRATRD